MSVRWGFDDLLEKMWASLDMIRIYTKPRGRMPDYLAPVVIPSVKCTVADFCKRIHRSLLDQFKHDAVVWGTSVKHQPQHAGRENQLADEDVVQVVKKIKRALASAVLFSLALIFFAIARIRHTLLRCLPWPTLSEFDRELARAEFAFEEIELAIAKHCASCGVVRN